MKTDIDLGIVGQWSIHHEEHLDQPEDLRLDLLPPALTALTAGERGESFPIWAENFELLAPGMLGVPRE